MNFILVSLIMSYLVFSFGDELTIVPGLRQYWVIKGSTVNLTCIHNETQTSQEHPLSFWKNNTQIMTGNGVQVLTFAHLDSQDETRVIRTLFINKSDFQFSDGAQYKCILGQDTVNYIVEAVIDVRVLEFGFGDCVIHDVGKKSINSIPVDDDYCIINCSASGVNPRDTHFTVTTQFRKVSDGKEQVLSNSTKFTISEEGNTLNISKLGRADAGEYRCLLIFNKDNKSSYQEVRSSPIYVRAIPKIETHDGNKILFLGETLKLRCTASGFPKPKITWKKDGTALNQTERVHLREEQLVILDLRTNDTGDYQCLASDPIYFFTDSAIMRVNVTDFKVLQSGGKGYTQNYPWAYIMCLLWLMLCGLNSGVKL